MKKRQNSTAYIIIPVFNRLNFTKKCLSSIKAQTYKNIVTIVVDSDSTDGTYKYIKENYPEVKIIKGKSNWWWTKSMYEGVKKTLKSATANDYILEMNNDCFFGKKYVSQLMKTSDKHPNKIIGSLCVKADNPDMVVEAGVKIEWSKGVIYGLSKSLSNEIDYYKSINIIENLDALPGKGTLLPVKVFREIGNFNYKRLPHYIADYEFTNRAKRAGYDLILDTKAKIYHHWKETGISFRSSGNKRSYKETWNLLFGRKSRNNLIDWINFLLLACPRKYLFVNLKITAFKILKSGLYVFPFYYVLPHLPTLAKYYRKAFKKN